MLHSPSPSSSSLLLCLSACLAVLPLYTSAQTTKPPFAASERVPACPGIPTSGENSLPHCYALMACQVPFLFCSLVFLPFFSHFLTLPLSWLFSLLASPSLCLHIALLSRFFQWSLSFSPSSLIFLILVDFMNSAVIFCCRPHTLTHTHCKTLQQSLFKVTQREILVTSCFYLHVFPCHREKLWLQEQKLC